MQSKQAFLCYTFAIHKLHLTSTYKKELTDINPKTSTYKKELTDINPTQGYTLINILGCYQLGS